MSPLLDKEVFFGETDKRKSRIAFYQWIYWAARSCATPLYWIAGLSLYCKEQIYCTLYAHRDLSCRMCDSVPEDT